MLIRPDTAEGRHLAVETIEPGVLLVEHGHDRGTGVVIEHRVTVLAGRDRSPQRVDLEAVSLAS